MAKKRRKMSDVSRADEAFNAFCDAYPHEWEGVLVAIADKAWDSKIDNSVSISDVHRINACNHVVSGTVLHHDKEYGFVI